MPIPLIPLRLVGLTLAGRTFVSKTGANPFTGRGTDFFRGPQRPRPTPVHISQNTIPNSLQNFVKGLSSQNFIKGLSSSFAGFSSSLNNITSSITNLLQGSQKEDLNAVVRNFVPADGTLLTPQYPTSGEKVRSIDLDGDSEEELVASYKVNNEIKTIILKRNEGSWSKIMDITNSDYDRLSYTGFADVAGEGRKQLLLGFKKQSHPGELYVYSLKDGRATKLFSHKYNKFEILNSLDTRGIPAKARLVFWNKDDSPLDRIEIKNWNGCELESAPVPSKYYSQKVLPVYGQRVKQNPQSPANWFVLADALTKAGMYRDGLEAVNIGLRLNPVSPAKEDFLQLKNILLEKLKN